MKSARQTAFEILNKIQRDESYSNLVLDSALDKAEIDIKEKEICFRTRLRCDGKANFE